MARIHGFGQSMASEIIAQIPAQVEKPRPRLTGPPERVAPEPSLIEGALPSFYRFSALPRSW